MEMIQENCRAKKEEYKIVKNRMRFGFVKKRERRIEQHFEKNEQKSEI